MDNEKQLKRLIEKLATSYDRHDNKINKNLSIQTKQEVNKLVSFIKKYY